MKYFVALIALVAAAAAIPAHKPALSDDDQLAAIIEAIHSPTTNPATAALLQQQLQQLFGIESIDVGPALVEEPSPIVVNPEPIVVGPPVISPPVVNPPVVSPPVVTPPVISPPVVEPPVVVSPPEVEPPVAQPPVVVLPPVVEPPVAQPPVVALPPLAPEAQPESSSVPLVQIILNINQAQSGDVAVPPGVAILPEIIDNDSVEPIVAAPPVLPAPVITLPETLN
ncbi:calphotin-like [Galleria mellonella]|uniref:Calphotin-like n=1 Tax=Galleria mellonella TaxID=7137 RepID=A0A6J3C0L1_GALME|nr:calphotin-like [Galleria mellonella]